MNSRGIQILAAAVCLTACLSASAGVKTITFENRDNCLEITNGTARLVIIPGAGGRVLHYSLDGGPDFYASGCQIDIGPELDYPPNHPALWSGPYAVEILGPLSVKLTSPEDGATGLQLIKVIEMDKEGAGVTVRATMKNISEKDVAYCLWDRTMTNADYGFFPLNPDSRFKARWSMRRGEPGSWRYDGENPSSPRVQIVGDLLVTVPGKKMEKVAADSMAGWIAGFMDGWLYIKRFPVESDGDYADGGNSVEFWVNDRGTMTEIEPLSPKVTLKPGETYTFHERWDLRRVDVEINSAEDIPKLLPYVKKMGKPLAP